MTDFKDLFIWTSARELAMVIYSLTKDFPSEEKFGVTSQIRRAAISISTNIAEGSGQSSDAGFLKFLHIAFASVCEVESLAYVSRDLEYLNNEKCDRVLKITVELKKMMAAFIERVRARI